MARPYSVRFMLGRGQARSEVYTVPEGMRAVVTAIDVAAWQVSTNGYIFVEVHGIAVVLWPAPGAQKSQHFDCRFVCYQHETIKAQMTGNDFSYGVAGYLFVDPVGRPDDADNVITPFIAGQLPANELPPADAG